VPCEHRAAPPYAEATVTVHEAVRSGAPEGTFEWTGPRYYATTEDGRRLVLGFEPQPGDTLRIGVRTTERVWLRQGRELLVLDR
jgi:hypothetical protein